jgi:hypothetical protein
VKHVTLPLNCALFVGEPGDAQFHLHRYAFASFQQDVARAHRVSVGTSGPDSGLYGCFQAIRYDNLLDVCLEMHGQTCG